MATGAGLLTLGLPGCDPGGGRVAVGGLGNDGVPAGNGGGVGGGPQNGIDGGTGNGNGNGGQDAGSIGGGKDAGSGQHDAGTTGGGQDSGTVNNSCTGPLNGGAASALAVGQVKHLTDNNNYDLFLCRDSGGLYAMDAVCPHAGCTVSHQSSQWYCQCHGATWDLNGQHPTSPANSALAHYSLCVDGSGNVLIDYNTTVPYTTRG